MTDHAAIARRLNLGPCELEVGAPWPYECAAKDKHPDDVVIVCHAHGAWWHEPHGAREA